MRPEYVARLEFEVKTIIRWDAPATSDRRDFINWAKRNGVPVGRGASAGSGRARLGITDLDPLRSTRCSALEPRGCRADIDFRDDDRA
jgi:DNA polymerase III alpha subunit